MINKEGKLFGLINIIDLLVIVVVIGAGVFIAKTFATKTSTPQKSFVIQYFSEDSPEYAIDTIKDGDMVVDEAKGVNLGKITDIAKGASMVYNSDSNGKVVMSNKEKYGSIILTTEVVGQESGNGFIVNGNTYTVGHGFTVLVGNSKLFLRVYDIKEK